MKKIILETKGIKKQFGLIKAVDGVDLSVRQGEVFGFLGPNGAGKTTTIGMILGLIHPTAGDVLLFGEAVSPAHTSALRKTGALVGAPALVPYLTARQNLELLRYLYPGLPSGRIERTLERVGLLEAADRKAGRFSTGMKQRLGLAMALLHEPELLVLDEPTNGMDPAGMREVRQLLRELAAGGTTIFLSSHLLHEVEQVCDRVAVLNKGKVVIQGTVDSLVGSGSQVKAWVDSPAEAAALLLTLPGVQRVEPNGVYVTVTGVSSQAVIQHLASYGILPSEVSNGRKDLEEIFIELTQEPA